MTPKQRLIKIFSAISWQDDLVYAWGHGCRNAFLHGLSDEAYAKGLITIGDYCQAKEAIALLGNDAFADDYERRFGEKLPLNSHLWDLENE